jgi:hypothetical protein
MQGPCQRVRLASCWIYSGLIYPAPVDVPVCGQCRCQVPRLVNPAAFEVLIHLGKGIRQGGKVNLWRRKWTIVIKRCMELGRSEEAHACKPGKKTQWRVRSHRETNADSFRLRFRGGV